MLERLFLLSWRDLGLLLLRVGLGLSMMTHGIPKLQGGPAAWQAIGGAMGNLGIHFAPTFWGFCAAFSEGVCAFLVVVGLATRASALSVAFTMFVAVVMHYTKDGIGAVGHPLELMFAFLAIAMLGAGKYSADAAIN